EAPGTAAQCECSRRVCDRAPGGKRSDVAQGCAMMEPASTQSLDAKVRRTELLISQTLRLGVALSLAIIILGLCITFIRHPDYAFSHHALSRLTNIGATFPHTLSELVFGLKALRGQSFVVLGLLLLIA